MDGGNLTFWESTGPAGGYEPQRNAESARRLVEKLYGKCERFQAYWERYLLPEPRFVKELRRFVRRRIGGVLRAFVCGPMRPGRLERFDEKRSRGVDNRGRNIIVCKYNRRVLRCENTFETRTKSVVPEFLLLG